MLDTCPPFKVIPYNYIMHCIVLRMFLMQSFVERHYAAPHAYLIASVSLSSLHKQFDSVFIFQTNRTPHYSPSNKALIVINSNKGMFWSIFSKYEVHGGEFLPTFARKCQNYLDWPLFVSLSLERTFLISCFCTNDPGTGGLICLSQHC